MLVPVLSTIFNYWKSVLKCSLLSALYKNVNPGIFYNSNILVIVYPYKTNLAFEI